MSTCPIRKLSLESLQKKTNIVDGIRIINRPLFDKLVSDQKAFDETAYGEMDLGDPFIVTKSEDKNPNNTRETRLSNNRYSETYQVNEPYYTELQRLADIKDKTRLTFDEVENLYNDELDQEPQGLQELIDSGEVIQFCNI